MPACIEKKKLLSGGEQTYACELMHYEPGFGILSYVVDREYVVGGFTLGPGDTTIAFYWEDRPYTLYTWKLPREGRTLYYFNIADSVVLKNGEFIWRDLAVDVLIDDTGRVQVLDEHELPDTIDDALGRYIETAKASIIANWRNIVTETEMLLNRRPSENSFNADKR